jgi:hypothetical protein
MKVFYKYPELSAYVERVYALPQLKKHLATRKGHKLMGRKRKEEGNFIKDKDGGSVIMPKIITTRLQVQVT